MSDCSTHAFDVPLRECPFCGGEAEKLTSIDGFTSIGCLNCNPFYGVMIQRITEAEAIAAWNSRADYHGYEQAAIEAWENIKAWNSRAELRSEPMSMRTFDSMETALSIAEKEVEIEELRRENYELCKENEELAHRRAELESAAHGTLTAEQVREAVYTHSINADCADADWQAIADELNSRAERACKLIRHGSLANMPSFICWSCSECGFGWHHSENDRQFSFCPNCGARRVDE